MDNISDEDDEDEDEQALDTKDGWPHSKAISGNQFFNLFNESKLSSAKRRVKRQADQYEYTPTKTRCPLLLVADYRFFQEMGGGNTKTTINYLVLDNAIFSNNLSINSINIVLI